MKVGACIVVYNEKDMLQACLKQFPEWVDEILVLVSIKPWYGMGANDPGRTRLVLQNIKDNRLKWIELNWRTEHDQRNFGLARLFEKDWVLIVDADEFYTPEDWSKIENKLKNPPEGTFAFCADRVTTYWKTPQYKLSPGDRHKPIIAVDPKKTVFFDKRETVEMLRGMIGIEMHHFSWVKADDEVWAKVHNWSHAKDFDVKTWYNKVWLKWDESMKNIHPYCSEVSTAVKTDPPEDIMDYFKN